jgi:Mg-chelatase subunit ChlI
MGVNVVEREGVSVWHPSRFILVGTMNPEEGELRPQLLDRFGLCVDVEGIHDVEQRVEIVERREAFEDDPDAFMTSCAVAEQAETDRISRAIATLPAVQVDRQILVAVAALGIELDVDGHRADLVTCKAAQALAAYEGKPQVDLPEVEMVAPMVLAHRVKASAGGGVRNINVGELLRAAMGGD